MKIEHIAETTSTNDEVRNIATRCDDDVVVCYTDYQTAGRGQKGNSWESEGGMNLLCSLLLKNTDVMAREQFCISEAVSLAIIDAVRETSEVECTIKWPNDIYVGDKKLCGILIENRLKGSSISECVIGIGLNLNQMEFKSDAPNPVSLKLITGADYDAEAILRLIVEKMQRWLQIPRQQLQEQYHSCLYRREGYFPYIDADGGFKARIHHVEPHGILVLEREDGQLNEYAFKEVSFIIDRQLITYNL